MRITRADGLVDRDQAAELCGVSPDAVTIWSTRGYWVTLTVNGEKVEGWMGAMTMNYTIDKEDALKNIKVGDQITAKVYDGDFKVLHEVQAVPASGAKAPDKSGNQAPAKK